MKLRGFTMIEILVVLVIIGVLATLGGAAYGKSMSRGRDTRRIEDMKAVQNGFEIYYSKHDGYAPIETMFADTAIFPKGSIADSDYVVTYTASDDTYCACANTENDKNYANSDAACNFAAATKTHYCVYSIQ